MGDLIEEYTKTFYLKDENVIPLMCAVAIGTKLPGDPIWLMLVGAPSSGKSELINALSDVDFIHQVSTLTENTFLSGMITSKSKETSLLHKIGPLGMIVMKDYTSILSMRSEKRDIIVSQMREIYDGHLVKKTGNGNDNEWYGKMNFIGGVTEKIYIAEEETAGMGRRAMYYNMPEMETVDRYTITQKASENTFDIKEKRSYIAGLFKEYIENKLANTPEEMPVVPKDFKDSIIELSNFVTIARTATERDKYHGNMKLASSAEMPMRMSNQLTMLASILIYMYGEVNETVKDIVTKMALDSIPQPKRLVLRELAKYDWVTSKGVAHQMNYPTSTVTEWLEDLNVMKLCDRVNETANSLDTWELREEYRPTMINFDKLTRREGGLKTGEDEEGSDDVGVMSEMQKKAERIFSEF